MANPKWDNASVEEKCEQLRDDIAKAFKVLNTLGDDIHSVSAKLRELSTAVEILKNRSSMGR